MLQVVGLVWAFFSVDTGGKSAPRTPKDIFDEKQPEIDKTELESLVNEVKEPEESDYTSDS